METSAPRLSLETAAFLGLEQHGQGWRLPFFNRAMAVTAQGILDPDCADLTPALAAVFDRYLSARPLPLPTDDGPWVTFREFAGASPLFSRFTANTAKTLEQTFAGRLADLALRCQALGAADRPAPGYDLTVEFLALPRIPVRLSFNDRDEAMPPTALFLYPETAIRLLDLKDLMTTCTWLTGMLIR